MPIGKFLFLLAQNRLPRVDDPLFIGKSLLGMLIGEKVKVGLTDRAGGIAEPKSTGQCLVDPGKLLARSLK